MNWNKWMRQAHRWFSVALTVAVLINLVAVLKGGYTRWLGLVAVVPLALLFFTGVYLFVLPYIAKSRSRRRVRSTNPPAG